MKLATSSRLTAVIPTKDRASDLRRVVASLAEQTSPPSSLIIVDQSFNYESRRHIHDDWIAIAASRDIRTRLAYVHDPGITGLTMARNRAMEIADGDIWLFLDDDVILEPEFIEELLSVYRENPDATGVSGIITNYPRPSFEYRIWSSIFVRGPFYDDRQPVYWRANQMRNSPPIPVTRLGGGLMSFRAEAVRGKFFDTNLRGVADGEDVDFCSRLGPSAKMLIAPSARLQHLHSPAGRLQDHWLRRSARGNIFLYRKNWRKGVVNRLCYVWLLVGYGLVVAFATVRRRSLEPLRALRTGLQEAHDASRREVMGNLN